ncbi:hypothetical protein AB0I60_06620 [Actinosynnema sp. NPDC050436]|uniref:hypothetical protein n=1 Tax=Actinosynnema sp. NPDC050436 TaxID=3155659 RepID=UPI0033DBF991
MTIPLTHRDWSVLRAVEAGRCAYAAGTLLIDGVCCCDQFLGSRLASAGLIARGPGPARLTTAGHALLDQSRLAPGALTAPPTPTGVAPTGGASAGVALTAAASPGLAPAGPDQGPNTALSSAGGTSSSWR